MTHAPDTAPLSNSLKQDASLNKTFSSILLQCVQDIHQNKPLKSALLVCPYESSALEAKLTNITANDWQTLSFEALKRARFTHRYDLAVVVLQKNEAGTPPIITKLRDVFAKRVLVVADKEANLIEFGFERLPTTSDNAPADISLWQFNILTYKQVPDWLNAKYWANPENWGKYRW